SSFSTCQPHRSTIFPYTTLFRSAHEHGGNDCCDSVRAHSDLRKTAEVLVFVVGLSDATDCSKLCQLELASAVMPTKNKKVVAALDRKSTRLNSSHVKISYAVFCL